MNAARNWITTGNVPAKVGVLVSFIGVSFLLKYAIDRELFNMPIEVRLLGVALAGLAMMGIGWRLRKNRLVYALVLQGGGAGILFLTVYAAMRIWQLVPESLAFVLLFLIAAVTGILAVLQNARTLALFGVTGGFLAPVLASTGEGSHVVLFSYYLVINLAILGIAWFRAWRVLNLVGFVFTFVVTCYWGYNYFRPELFASTEPFLVLFFLFYQAIAILYALRRPPDKPGVVDGTLVFGTPVIAFGLQSALLYGSEYGLAISAAVLALFYTACTIVLRRRAGDYLRLLSDAYLALAVVFGTIAIPLALDARWTSAAWAVEGAALVWIGVRQGQHLSNLAGFVLLILSGITFASFGWRDDIGLAVFNGNVLGGVMVGLAAFFSSRCLDRFERESAFDLPYGAAAMILFGWGVVWWLGTGWTEILDRTGWPHSQVEGVRDARLPLVLSFTALSAGAAVFVGRARDWGRMRSITAIFLPLLVLIALRAFFTEWHFLYSWCWIAWPVALAVQLYALKDMDLRGSSLARNWHILSLLFITSLFALEVHWRVDRIASMAWATSASIALAGAMALLVWQARQRPSWPVPAHLRAYLAAGVFLVVIQALTLSIVSIKFPGDADPLPYLPVINPFGLGLLFSILTAAMATKIATRDAGFEESGMQILRVLFGAALFVMTTAALVRAVHQFTTVPWRFDDLFDSVMVQTSLSIYWGLLGFIGMVAGARTARRAVWIIGAAFMALVVVKLFLVDLGNTGTLARIVSFIGTGALLLVVGYFAPAPPRPEVPSSQT